MFWERGISSFGPTSSGNPRADCIFHLSTEHKCHHERARERLLQDAWKQRILYGFRKTLSLHSFVQGVVTAPQIQYPLE